MNRPPLKQRLNLLLVVAAIGCLLLAYVVSYVVLSLKGRYEPLAWGLNHGRHYGWIPHKFTKPRPSAGGPAAWDFNRPVALFYYPLWHLDRSYWHTEAEAWRKKAP
jgi:hypothetical protein